MQQQKILTAAVQQQIPTGNVVCTSTKVDHRGNGYLQLISVLFQFIQFVSNHLRHNQLIWVFIQNLKFLIILTSMLFSSEKIFRKNKPHSFHGIYFKIVNPRWEHEESETKMHLSQNEALRTYVEVDHIPKVIWKIH